MGVRIFTLAKELDMTSKELISFLKTQGHKVSSHMSSIDDPVAKILRDRLKPKAAEAPAEKPKASPAAAKGGESKATGTATRKAPATAATGTAFSPGGAAGQPEDAGGREEAKRAVNAGANHHTCTGAALVDGIIFFMTHN